MKNITLTLVCFIGGIVCHQLYYPTDRLGDRLRKNTRHALGVACAVPFFVLWLARLWPGRLCRFSRALEWAVGSYLATFATFGWGVLFGDIGDALRGR